MKDAVLTSKCCFKSFCDKYIRDYIISKSMCVYMESARYPQPKIPSPTSSAVSKGELKISPINEGAANIQDTTDEIKAVSAPQQAPEHIKIPRAGDVSEATHESMSVKEPVSQGNAPVIEEEVQQKLVPTEAGKKKKKKKVRMPANDFQWKPPHDLGAENYMMPPMGPPPSYNPYWNGMQPCMDGFMPPYAGPMHMNMMGYGVGPYDMPSANGMPHDPFGMQGYMMPPITPPPHRDLAEFSMGMNVPPPAMREFEARKADLRRKRENERRVERYKWNLGGYVMF
ncbi:DWNN domain, a CCHC-type zinc finger [Trifolium repens]|nr:DWNN domain, a CCHC-type zinc finger [Trifolium repens]